MEPSFEGGGRSENLLKKLFHTKQPRLKQLQKEGRVELEGDQQQEVEDAIIQPDVSHPLYAVAPSSLTHLEDKPSKSILKNRLLNSAVGLPVYLNYMCYRKDSVLLSNY